MDFSFSNIAVAVALLFENSSSASIVDALKKSDAARVFCGSDVATSSSSESNSRGGSPMSPSSSSTPFSERPSSERERKEAVEGGGGSAAASASAVPHTSVEPAPFLAICEVEFIDRCAARQAGKPVEGSSLPDVGGRTETGGESKQDNVSNAGTESASKPLPGVVVATSLTTLLAGAQLTPEAKVLSGLMVSDVYYRPKTCVVLTRRTNKNRGVESGQADRKASSLDNSTAQESSGTPEKPSALPKRSGTSRSWLTLKDLNLVTVDLSAPLDQLQSMLSNLYEPSCNTQKDETLRSQMQDLASAIRSRNSGLLSDFDIIRYVHPEIVELCRANPNADVKTIMEIIGARATDAGFVRQVQNARSRGITALQADIYSKEVVSTRDEVAYWLYVSRWIEKAQAQLPSREWKVVHRILGHRVDSQYEIDLQSKTILAKEYFKYLQHIPYTEINGATEQNIGQLATDIFSEVGRVSKYPDSRKRQIADSLVKELCSRLVELAGRRLLRVTVTTPTEILSLLGKFIDSLDGFLVQYSQAVESLKKERTATYGMSYQSPTRGTTTGSSSPRGSSGLMSGSDRISTYAERARTLRDMLDDHYCFYGELWKAFHGTMYVDILEEMESALEQFAAAAEPCVWDISDTGVVEFTRCRGDYGDSLQSIDERVAMLAGSLLASAQESKGGHESSGQVMHRIHHTFRYMRREKIQNVVAHFQGPLLEIITSGIKEAQESYFDAGLGNRTARLMAARYDVTPMVGRIVWEKSVERSIAAYLVKRDSVSDFGWHQLLSMQTFECRWRLNQVLAQFLGFQLEDLITKDFQQDSEVHGTAYALAYLEVLYADDRADWETAPGIRSAQHFIARMDPRATDAAMSRLVIIGVGKRNKAEHARSHEARSARAMISQRIDDKVAHWCTEVRQFMSTLALSPDSYGIQRTHVFTIAQRGGANASSKGDAKGTLELSVDFPQCLRVLLNDLRYLSSTKLVSSTTQRIVDIRTFFGNNEHRLLMATTLRELLKTFHSIVGDQEFLVALLVTEEYTRFNQALTQGAKLRWGDDGAVQIFVNDLAEKLSDFFTATEHVRLITSTMEDRVQQLSETFYMPQELMARMGELRTLAHRLGFRSPNAQVWIRQLLPQLESILVDQLEAFIRCWTEEFCAMTNDTQYLDPDMESELFKLRPLRVRMRIVFKDIHLETSPPEWRSYWFSVLNESLSWLNQLPVILNTNVLSMNNVAPYRVDYSRLVEQLPSRVLLEPLRAIEQSIEDAINVEAQWRSSQQFLNLDVGVIQQHLGDDLEQWNTALQQIKLFATRQMDATQPNKLLGGIVIIAEDAQRELGRKLDQVSTYINTKFRDILEVKMDQLYRSIGEEKTELERCNVINDLNDTATFLCRLPEVKRSVVAKEEALKVLTESEAYLKRQGYPLAESWIHVSRLKDEFRAFKDVVDRKAKALEFRRPFLHDSLRDEAVSLEGKVKELQHQLKESDLDEQKLSASAATALAGEFVDKADALYKNLLRISSAQRELGEVPVENPQLVELVASTTNLSKMWSNAASIISVLDSLGKFRFAEVVPRALQESLEQVWNTIEEFPIELREFSVYVGLRARVQEYLSLKRLFQDLRSDAMMPVEHAERHWLSLKMKLKATWDPHLLTVQDIWDTNPTANIKIYLGVVELAQGERRLEAQINAISSYWSVLEVDYIVYQNRVCLVRGWDVLFEKVTDDLVVLNAMRSSPYFESQHIVSVVSTWEKTLNTLHTILDTLMDVQRRWVYLDGVFSSTSGSADIRQQLAQETMQFARASKDFVGLLPSPKAMTVNPLSVMWLVEEQKRLSATLDRVGQQLSQIQRALSDFLDVQRARFPRFFFVGDDDLLEIMGNSKNPYAVAKHLRKLFTGIASLLVSGADSGEGTADGESGSNNDITVIGLISPEGEEVPFDSKHAVPISGAAVHEWLAAVEKSMHASLRQQLSTSLKSTHDKALEASSKGRDASGSHPLADPAWMSVCCAQVASLTLQITWAQEQEVVLRETDPKRRAEAAAGVVTSMTELLDSLAGSIASSSLSPFLRHKIEQLITLAVYQRDVSRELNQTRVESPYDFRWLRTMRLYYVADGRDAGVDDLLLSNKPGLTLAGGKSTSPADGSNCSVVCKMADAAFEYGFEYLGMQERLVQTPLTDKCFLTLTQALCTGLGGSPSGPAGTGKTETVKALGSQLGRHVLVFNCDESFDFQAMGRIFAGLCQVGAWGCFDEFNRLEERILSAVSQQIQCIQEGLRQRVPEVQLGDRNVRLHSNVGIFITMNPGYAGRSQLPDNLKQLFRGVTMITPDKETIAQVMLFAQGFRSAETLSRKVVPLFRLCEDQLSKQSHYDFGLRALKSVLVTAGNLKRIHTSANKKGDGSDASNSAQELQLMVRSLIETVSPKLVTDDVQLFAPLVRDFFPGEDLPQTHIDSLQEVVDQIIAADSYTASPAWVTKIMQLYNTRSVHHGIMLVGPTGCGKTSCWQTLMRAMAIHDDIDGHAVVINPKALTKAELFGTLDVTTRQWKDGVFTSELRRILDNAKDGDLLTQQHWIIFDGDVDPEWVENLNSVLDDNKVLTLPNGERLALPANVRVIFEVQDLRFATPATISRCGMLWFSEGTIALSSMLSRFHKKMLATSVVTASNIACVCSTTLASTTDALSSSSAQLSEHLRNAMEAENRSQPLVSRGGTYFHVERKSSIQRRMDRRMETNKRTATTDTSDMDDDSQYIPDDLNTTNVYPESNASTSLVFQDKEDNNAHNNVPGRGGSSEAVKVFHVPDETERRAEQGYAQPSSAVGEWSASQNHHRELAGGRRRQSVDALMQIQRIMASVWEADLSSGGKVERAIDLFMAKYAPHSIMHASRIQFSNSILALLTGTVANMWYHNESRRESQESGNMSEGNSGTSSIVVIAEDTIRKYAANRLTFALLWGLGSQLNNQKRVELADELGLTLPRTNEPRSSSQSGTKKECLLDYEVDIEQGIWREWRDRVQLTEISAEKVGTNDTIIPTIDTTRHEAIITAWLTSGMHAILCGPPGSGKTMSMSAVLRTAHAVYDVAYLNFSSATGPEIILRTLEQYCTTQNTASGLVMLPASGKTLILFCDEINLPALDRYGTQRVVQLLRQLTERGGFFRTRDNKWITVQNVQIVGACNPPTDPGRVPLSLRFLRWTPVLFVDFPTHDSLLLIYQTYCRAFLREGSCANLLPYSPSVAGAMVSVYEACQTQFTTDMQLHYVYSPRELSRWCRAVYEGLQSTETDRTIDSLVRLAVHEGLRLFQDRLVLQEEREWFDACIDRCFQEHFPGRISARTLERPILFSSLLSDHYSDVSRDDLRSFLEKRLKVFCEEEVDTALVVYDDMIDHILRVDHILRQPLGHALLVGVSGVGKTIVSRYVAWLNQLSVFQIKVHSRYTLHDFEEDLRSVMQRAGCKQEKICFIFDESNIVDPSFLEYMNALLASGEVPGLFDGEYWSKLMSNIHDSSRTLRSEVTGMQAGGASSNAGMPTSTHPQSSAYGDVAATNYVDLSSEQEMYRWFVRNVQRHLHVVFTMNPQSADFHTRGATSPALYNRCTIDWFGDWSIETLTQIVTSMTRDLRIYDAKEKTFRNEAEARQIVAQVMCTIHGETERINSAIRAKNINRGAFITPRHFIEFTKQLRALYTEKRGKSSEQVTHLLSGLAKLKETSESVNAQQRLLREREVQLKESSQRAQEMLDTIVNETEKAKKGKADAQRLKEKLKSEQKRINDERTRVEQQLEDAVPALRAAEQALNTIKPEYLREIRGYATPPPMVRRVLEAVVTLMGEREADRWDVLKTYIRRDDFIAQVKAFQPSDITDEARERVKKIQTDANFTYDNAMRASKAAGPLHQWQEAQVRYSEIFVSVGPMRKEVEKLSTACEKTKEDLQQTEKEIERNEQTLLHLKQEYQRTTERTSEIKLEITGVSTRCERASKLLSSLLMEKTRWEEEAANFATQSVCVLGDCIVSSAFLAYIGYFDQHTRRSVLLPSWRTALASHGVPLRDNLSVVDYLVSPSQRLDWDQHHLPKDELCMENATIIQRLTERYPLIIDPSGNIVQFLLSAYKTRKIEKTSFTKNFIKPLEMAMRFGYPILIEDAELMDPVIGPLLNREVRCNSGRTIVRLGPQDVDVAPTFTLFLSTRSSSYQFSASISGTACMVNFSVTLASLQSQCLHQVLTHERPDVDAKRTELQSIQSEYVLKLRMLEQELLTCIAESEGKILDNDKLIQTLEVLKTKSKEITEKIAHSDDALREIIVIESKYASIAQTASQLYFSLKTFATLSSLYHFDVNFLIRLLGDALAGETLGIVSTSGMDEDAVNVRRADVLRRLLVLAHHRVSRSTFSRHHIVLGLRLAQLRSLVKDSVGSQISDVEWGWMMDRASVQGDAQNESSVGALGTSLTNLPPILQKHLGLRSTDGNCPSPSRSTSDASSAAGAAVAALLAKQPFAPHTVNSLQNASNAAAWNAFLTDDGATASACRVPDDCFGDSDLSPARRAFFIALLVLHVRQDAFEAACEHFLRIFFGDNAAVGSAPTSTPPLPFFNTKALDLDAVVRTESSEQTPVLLVAEAGSNPSGRVEGAARRSQVTLRTVALGSAEGYRQAELYIEEGAKTGGWVMLKNGHLAPQFLSTIEKRLRSSTFQGGVSKNFRLFFTCEAIENRIPESLVEASIVIVFETPPGVRSSLSTTLGAMVPSKAGRTLQVAENRALLPRMYLAVAWLHAVAIERQQYVPVGWTKRFEVSESEFWQSIQVAENWLRISEKMASEGGTGSGPVSAHSIPWLALQELIATTIYGGKIGNAYDQAIMDAFCRRHLSESMFSADKSFSLAENGALRVDMSREDEKKAFRTLEGAQASVESHMTAQVEAPEWLGLPSTASTMVRAQRGADTVRWLSQVDTSFDEGEDSEEATDGGGLGFGSTLRKHSSGGGNVLSKWSEKQLNRLKSWFTRLSKVRSAAWVDSVHAESQAYTDTSSHGCDSDGDVKSVRPVDPLHQTVRREAEAASSLLRLVYDDVLHLISVLDGAQKATNRDRDILSLISRDAIPSVWTDENYSSRLPRSLSVDDWLTDLLARVENVKTLIDRVTPRQGEDTRRVDASALDSDHTTIHLGQLFYPSAFLTATRQQAARSLHCPLESMTLEVVLYNSAQNSTTAHKMGDASSSSSSSHGPCYRLGGLKLYSAALTGNAVSLRSTRDEVESRNASTRVEALIRWRIATGAISTANNTLVSNDPSRICVPLYLNNRKDDVLETFNLPICDGDAATMADTAKWYQLGTCLIAWES